jgi:hypothetical protein
MPRGQEAMYQEGMYQEGMYEATPEPLVDADLSRHLSGAGDAKARPTTSKGGVAEPLLPPAAHGTAPLEDNDAEDFAVLSGEVMPPDDVVDEEEAEEGDPWWDTLGNLPAQTLRRPDWTLRMRTAFSYMMPFGLRERAAPSGAWRPRALLLAATALLVLFTAVISVTAFGLASRLVHAASDISLGANSATPPSDVVIQPLNNGGAPTPALPDYLIGAWVSDSAPSGGSVQVFVRVSHNSDPVPGVPVRLLVNFSGSTSTFGPADTDAYGLATITVSYGGGYSGYTPVFVTATAAVGGQTITAQTSFAPK